MRVVGTLLLCGAAFASACGSTPPESIAFADDAPLIAEPPVVELTADELELVTFHSEWLCELQRRTFGNLDETETALNGTLDAAGITRPAYDEFLADGLSTQSVRDAVFFEHQQNCRAK